MVADKNAAARAAAAAAPDKRRKRAYKRKPHKRKKKSAAAQAEAVAAAADPTPSSSRSNGAGAEDHVTVEYVANPLDQLDPSMPGYEEWARIFAKFVPDGDGEPEVNGDDSKQAGEQGATGSSASARVSAVPVSKDVFAQDSSEDEAGTGDGSGRLSKRKLRKATRLTVAQLKQMVSRPDVVDTHDPNSTDPLLLVYLKAYRNSVPVPRHWAAKSRYLSAKKGMEKLPYELPAFIKDTGIAEMRDTGLGDDKKLKQKQRDRLMPRSGKLDIDYAVLHDAFFRFQTKPKLTGPGDLYFANKEYEVTAEDRRPGVLSARLREALGMTEGAPPPWLIAMQRYGPPPAYPGMKIPGVNAPIPQGASFGFQPGGWGQPPVDEHGQPLYGDVFGQAAASDEALQVPIDRTPWGAVATQVPASAVLGDDADAEAGDEAEADDTDAMAVDQEDGTATPAPEAGIETPAEPVDLRKPLYHVLPEQRSSVASSSIMGSAHTYVLPSQGGDSGAQQPNAVLSALRGNTANVDVSLDPAELEGMDQRRLRERYEEGLAAQRSASGHLTEDVSDVVAEETLRRKRKAAAKDKSSGYKF